MMTESMWAFLKVATKIRGLEGASWDISPSVPSIHLKKIGKLVSPPEMRALVEETENFGLDMALTNGELTFLPKDSRRPKQ